MGHDQSELVKYLGTFEDFMTPEELQRMRGTDLLSRITINPAQCGGRPCIRGMRIRVIDVLDLLATGMTHEQILRQLPDLEEDDIRASLVYAARYLDHPRLSA